MVFIKTKFGVHSLLSSEETRSVHLNIWQPGITKQGGCFWLGDSQKSKSKRSFWIWAPKGSPKPFRLFTHICLESNEKWLSPTPIPAAEVKIENEIISQLELYFSGSMKNCPISNEKLSNIAGPVVISPYKWISTIKRKFNPSLCWYIVTA